MARAWLDVLPILADLVPQLLLDFSVLLADGSESVDPRLLTAKPGKEHHGCFVMVHEELEFVHPSHHSHLQVPKLRSQTVVSLSGQLL